MSVDFAFVRPPPSKGQAGNKGGRKGGRQRSASPGAARGREEVDDGEVE